MDNNTNCPCNFSCGHTGCPTDCTAFCYCACNCHKSKTNRCCTNSQGVQKVTCSGNSCGRTNCHCRGGGAIETINVEFTQAETFNNKNKTIDEALLKLSDCVTIDRNNANYIFTTPTKENLQKYFTSLEKSKLSKSQQILLLDQITVDFVETNVLNIYPNVRNLLKIKKYDKEELQKQIHELIKNIVQNIILTSNYKETFLNFNYSQAFQVLYYFVSLLLYRLKSKIVHLVYFSIIDK